MTDKTKGYIYGALAAATYGTNPVFAVPLYADGMNADSVLFFRYLFALPILYFMIVRRGHGMVLERRQILPVVILGLVAAASSLTLYLSYNYMDVGIASTLLFVYPIMVAGIMAVRFGERISLLTWGCMAVAGFGIALLYNGSPGDATLSTVGIGLVMMSAFAYALYMVYINRTSLNGMPTIKVTFYVLFFGLTLFGFRLGTVSYITLPHEWYHWVFLFALALLPTAISFVFTTMSIQHIGATPTAILGALEPVTALVFGVLVFGEHLTPRSVIGIVLIITAVTTIVAGGGVVMHLLRVRRLFPKLPRRKKG